MLKLLNRSLSSEGASSLLLITVLLQRYLHCLKTDFLLVTLFERLLSLLKTSYKVDVAIKVFHILLHVFLDLVEGLPDAFVDAFSNLEEMDS